MLRIDAVHIEILLVAVHHVHFVLDVSQPGPFASVILVQAENRALADSEVLQVSERRVMEKLRVRQHGEAHDFIGAFLAKLPGSARQVETD